MFLTSVPDQYTHYRLAISATGLRPDNSQFAVIDELKFYEWYEAIRALCHV